MTSKAALDKSRKSSAVLLPGWNNIAADSAAPDFGLVIGSLALGRLLEYEVITGGEPQGTAVCAFGKKVAVTTRGAWFEGFHLCATDRRNDLYMLGPKLELSGMTHRFHICAKLPCKKKSPEYPNAVHISKWRILTFAQGESLPYVGRRLRDFAAASAEAAAGTKPSGEEETDDDGTADDDLGDIDGEELSVATQERLFKAAKTAAHVPKQLAGKEASAAIWGAALGGTPPGSSNDHEGLDAALAKSLAESDVAGALAAKKFGIKLVGGLSVKPGGIKPAVAGPSPATPKAKGPPPVSSDEEVLVEEAVDVPEGDDEPLDGAGQFSTVALQAQMLRNAAALVRKRAKPAAKSEPLAKHQRLVKALAAMLTGQGDGGDGDGLADEDEDAEQG